MSKVLEAMKEEGWIECSILPGSVLAEHRNLFPENEYVMLFRPKPKPNAIVDFATVEAFDSWSHTISRPIPCGAEIPKEVQDAIRSLRQAIKRAP